MNTNELMAGTTFEYVRPDQLTDEEVNWLCDHSPHIVMTGPVQHFDSPTIESDGQKFYAQLTTGKWAEVLCRRFTVQRPTPHTAIGWQFRFRNGMPKEFKAKVTDETLKADQIALLEKLNFPWKEPEEQA